MRLTETFALAAPIFMITVAILVFAARPAGGVNRAAAAFLVLWGAGDLMWYLMWFGPAESAGAYLRTGHWFTTTSLFAGVVLLYVLFATRGLRGWPALGLGAAFTLIILHTAAFIWDPNLFAQGTRPASDGRNIALPGTLSPFMFNAVSALNMIAILTAARAAASPTSSTIERKQAAYVGLGFLLLGLNHGVRLLLQPLLFFTDQQPSPLVFLQFVWGLALVASSAYALPRFLPRLPVWGRVVIGTLVTIAVVHGIGLTLFTFIQLHWGVPTSIPWWQLLRRLLAFVFAVLLGLAFVRFGMAGFGRTYQHRITVLARAALALAVFALPALVLLLVREEGYVAFAALLAVGVFGVSFTPGPVRTMATSMGRILALDPTTDAAVAERTRRYTDALESSLASTGHLPSSQEAALVELRRELDLTDDDHVQLAGLIEALHTGPQANMPRLLGRYLVEKELGRGTFGVALLATDQATGRRVVLKRYHTGKGEGAAMEEARTLRQVRHPRIVPLYAVERVGSEVFLVMGYASGGTLNDRVEQQGAMPPEQAFAFAADLLDALGALHAAGLAHRDVKPANLLLDEEGRLVLADLGASRFTKPTNPLGDATLTTAPVIGTYTTVAPEVLTSSSAGPRTDVYAAGAVIYKLLTGEDYTDFSGRSPVEVMNAILYAPPRLPHPKVPPPVASVLQQAMQKDPADRYPDANEMGTALTAALKVTVPSRRGAPGNR